MLGQMVGMAVVPLSGAFKDHLDSKLYVSDVTTMTG